mmetsp:Transcript_38960/g.91751  ORF Transcript_38960/g.91751 Transcript_38960/m.91751 type:complete len:311 (+) Transcript_38960:209-1141(+)
MLRLSCTRSQAQDDVLLLRVSFERSPFTFFKGLGAGLFSLLPLLLLPLLLVLSLLLTLSSFSTCTISANPTIVGLFFIFSLFAEANTGSCSCSSCSSFFTSAGSNVRSSCLRPPTGDPGPAMASIKSCAIMKGASASTSCDASDSVRWLPILDVSDTSELDIAEMLSGKDMPDKRLASKPPNFPMYFRLRFFCIFLAPQISVTVFRRFGFLHPREIAGGQDASEDDDDETCSFGWAGVGTVAGRLGKLAPRFVGTNTRLESSCCQCQKVLCFTCLGRPGAEDGFCNESIGFPFALGEGSSITSAHAALGA